MLPVLLNELKFYLFWEDKPFLMDSLSDNNRISEKRLLMNILLVYPKMPNTFWSMDYATKVLGKKAMYPPLGLLTISNLLPTNWNKRLIDLNVTALRNKDISWADYVFISAMNVQEKSACEVIKQCRKINVKIVAGGTLFTHEYDKYPDIDYFVLNEAEITLPEFLRDLRNGSPKPIYKTNLFADVTTTPLPDWSLAKIKDYNYAIVQYSRGCPYRCDFCDVTALFGAKPRIKTSAQIIAELEEIIKYKKFPFVLFADDNLIGNRRALKEDLLPALIEWRKEFRPSMYFATQVTVNLADDDELIRLMLEAGFRNIFIGIETPNEISLAKSQKTQNLKRNLLESIRKLHSRGFIVVGGFIVGFDSDDETIFQRQMDFIQESGIVLSTLNMLKAPPGTELYERMKKERRLIDTFSFHEGKTNIVPNMDKEILEKGFTQLIENVYSPDLVYQRIKTFLKDYRYPQIENKIPDLPFYKQILPLLRVFYFVGVRSNVRIYIWKIIFWTIRNRKKYVDQGILNGIMIYQLNLLLNDYLKDLEPKSEVNN